ncbi:unnamed protein product [Brassica rapa subsp. trilocularis]|uniref:Uncharacterized protein n=1 Tax=Brassica campestris TaxID=3711 RepID=A0A3P6A763_BRACM|nr:unnamed protein product [Brassica rapa]
MTNELALNLYVQVNERVVILRPLVNQKKFQGRNELNQWY